MTSEESIRARLERHEKQKRRKKIIDRCIVFGLIGSLLGAIIGLVLSYINYHDGSKSPLGWCLWEIHTHENYDCDFAYFYQELEPKNEMQKEADKGCKVYGYYITVFTDDRKAEWYCFMEGFHRHIVDIFFDTKNYKAEEVYLIDCDIAFESLYEGEIL